MHLNALVPAVNGARDSRNDQGLPDCQGQKGPKVPTRRSPRAPRGGRTPGHLHINRDGGGVAGPPYKPANSAVTALCAHRFLFYFLLLKPIPLIN